MFVPSFSAVYEFLTFLSVTIYTGRTKLTSNIPHKFKICKVFRLDVGWKFKLALYNSALIYWSIDILASQLIELYEDFDAKNRPFKSIAFALSLYTFLLTHIAAHNLVIINFFTNAIVRTKMDCTVHTKSCINGGLV